MEYTIEITIKAPPHLVSSLFVNKEKMPEWEEGLTKIISSSGQLFETGSHGTLVFHTGGQAMNMNVEVVNNDLPKRIDIVYRVPGAYNRCRNYFEEDGQATKWTMEVIFRFDEPIDLPLSVFQEKTERGMVKFKEFVEREHREALRKHHI